MEKHGREETNLLLAFLESDNKSIVDIAGEITRELIQEDLIMRKLKTSIINMEEKSTFLPVKFTKRTHFAKQIKPDVIAELNKQEELLEKEVTRKRIDLHIKAYQVTIDRLQLETNPLKLETPTLIFQHRMKQKAPDVSNSDLQRLSKAFEQVLKDQSERKQHQKPTTDSVPMVSETTDPMQKRVEFLEAELKKLHQVLLKQSPILKNNKPNTGRKDQVKRQEKDNVNARTVKSMRSDYKKDRKTSSKP